MIYIVRLRRRLETTTFTFTREQTTYSAMSYGSPPFGTWCVIWPTIDWCSVLVSGVAANSVFSDAHIVPRNVIWKLRPINATLTRVYSTNANHCRSKCSNTIGDVKPYILCHFRLFSMVLWVSSPKSIFTMHQLPPPQNKKDQKYLRCKKINKTNSN